MNEKSRNTCNIGNKTLREDIQNKNKAQKTKRLTPTSTKTGNETKANKKKPIKKNTHSEPNKTSQDRIQLQQFLFLIR